MGPTRLKAARKTLVKLTPGVIHTKFIIFEPVFNLPFSVQRKVSASVCVCVCVCVWNRERERKCENRFLTKDISVLQKIMKEKFPIQQISPQVSQQSSYLQKVDPFC